MYLFTVVEGYNSDRVCGRICVLMCVTCVGLQIHVFFICITEIFCEIK